MKVREYHLNTMAAFFNPVLLCLCYSAFKHGIEWSAVNNISRHSLGFSSTETRKVFLLSLPMRKNGRILCKPVKRKHGLGVQFYHGSQPCNWHFARFFLSNERSFFIPSENGRGKVSQFYNYVGLLEKTHMVMNNSRNLTLKKTILICVILLTTRPNAKRIKLSTAALDNATALIK